MACSTTVILQDRTLDVTALRLTTVVTHVSIDKTQSFNVKHGAKVEFCHIDSFFYSNTVAILVV